MIEITFYRNGFEINGHAVPEICYQVSILAWAFSNLILEEEQGDWYTADYDNSNAGYSHCVYAPTDGKGNLFLKRFKEMVTVWADHYKWQEEHHVKIVDNVGLLVIPENFKELKGINQREVQKR